MLVATIDPWQRSSPTGGLMHSEYVAAAKLQLGMVIRTPYGWAPITGARSWVHLRDYVAVEAAREWRIVGGAEVRTDVRVDLDAVIAPCGCWMTVDGSWTCDEHLHQRRSVR